MWHEARKQEKKIRGMLVDYKKRAERRKEYYERIKLDPTQFIQIHGRACKIHLDPAIHYAAEAPGSMMPWRGDKDSMIDRFDVRAHLDDIPTFDRNAIENLTQEQQWEERQANYERYRILVQNEFLGVKEEKFLNQIRLEELFGPVGNRSIEDEKKALMPKKAAIGFVYGEPSGGEVIPQTWGQVPAPHLDEAEEDSADDSDSDIDLDLTVDVLSLSNQQQMELNVSGVEYGLNPEDFMELMSRDLEEAEALRIAKEHEDEKAMYSGRKSRKERRALKKKHLDRKLSPPSYAARSSPTYGAYHRLSSKSHSRSPSPPCGTSQIKYITSFGEDTDGPHSDAEDGEAGVILIPEGNSSSRLMSTSSSNARMVSTTSSVGGDRSSRKWSSTSSNTSSSRRNKRHHHRRSSSRSRERSRSSSRKRKSPLRSRKHHRRSGSYSRSRSRSGERSRKRRYGDSESQSYSRSRSRSKSASVNRKDQKSPKDAKKPIGHPPAPEEEKATSLPALPSPPRRRYYGRRAENSDSEELDSGPEEGSSGATVPCHNPSNVDELTNWASNSISTSSGIGNEASVDKVSGAGSKLTPQERLKKKMQALLKKQYKADKKLEKERAVKAEQERQDREEELREIAIKLRRREREKRHRLHGEEESNSEETQHSRTPSKSPPPPVRNRIETRHRERENFYERETEKESERLRLKERWRERENREKDPRKYSPRPRSRERYKEKMRERYRGRESAERERRNREEDPERYREDSYRERDAARSRSHHAGSRGYGHTSYGHPRDGARLPPRIWDNPPPLQDQHTESYMSSSDNRKIRLVDY